MAKINRYDGNVQAFAAESLGTERTIFGSETQADTLDQNINADFLRGWGIVGVNENPTKQDFNAAFYTLSQLIAYLHQAGIPEWNAAQEVFEGGVVTTIAGIYRLKAGGDSTVNPDTDDGTNWDKAPTAQEYTRTFESVADLQASGAVEVGQFVRTLGYYTPGDGGGNDYEIVAGATGADDGGSFIDLSGSGLQAKGLFQGGVNVKQFGAKGDGVTNDLASFQAANDYLAVNKGGKGGTLFVPAVNSYYKILNFIKVGSGVHILGEGESSFIWNTRDSNTSEDNIFLFGSNHPQQYSDYTYYACNSLSKGGDAITTEIASDIGNFSEGQAVLIRSQEADSAISDVFGNGAETPYFVEINRIKTIDVTTGRAVMAYPLTENVSNPLVTDMTGGSFQLSETGVVESYIADRSSIKNLSVKTKFQWIFRQGCFECEIENIYVKQARQLISFNSDCRGLWNNVRGSFTHRFAQMATGAHDTRITNVSGGYLKDPDVPVSGLTLIEFTEANRQVTLDNFRVTAGGYDGNQGVLFRAARNHKVTNGYIDAVSITGSGVKIKGEGLSYPDTDLMIGNIVDNVEFRFGAVLVDFLELASTNNSTDSTRIRNNTIRDCSFYGNPTGRSLIGRSGQENRIEGNYFENGIFLYLEDFLQNSIKDNSCPAINMNAAFAQNNHSGNYRSGAKETYAAKILQPTVNAGVSVSSTTPNNVVKTFTMTSNQALTTGDRFKIKIGGDVIGAGGTKDIQIHDSGGSLHSLATFAAGDQASFEIDGTILLEPNTVTRSVIKSVDSVNKAQVTEIIRSGLDLDAFGRVIELQAWVANAADAVRFNWIEIVPEFMGDKIG